MSGEYSWYGISPKHIRAARHYGMSTQLACYVHSVRKVGIDGNRVELLNQYYLNVQVNAYYCPISVPTFLRLACHIDVFRAGLWPEIGAGISFVFLCHTSSGG